MKDDYADESDASLEEGRHLEEREGDIDLLLLASGELSGEDSLNQGDYRYDDQKQRSDLPWLLDVVVDITQEDEANA